MADVQPDYSRLAPVLRAVLPVGALSADASTGSIVGPLGRSEIQEAAQAFAQGDSHCVARISRRDPKLWAHWQMGVRRGSMAGAV